MIKEVDFSYLLSLLGSIVQDRPLELELLKKYKWLDKDGNSFIDSFTQDVLHTIYKDDKTRPYAEINNFFNSQEYLTKVNRIIDYITIIINRNINPLVTLDVKVNKITKHSDTELLVELDILESGDENG